MDDQFITADGIKDLKLKPVKVGRVIIWNRKINFLIIENGR